jgi:CRP-like cAMP-binding protein
VGSILFDVGATIDYTWFITSGIVSLPGATEDGASFEVAMAGRDGAIGFPGILSKSGMAFRAQAPIAGATRRVGASASQATIKQESEIYVPLLDHTHTLSEQIAQAIVCSQFHTTDQRFARWLLLVRDRTRNGAFNIMIMREAMAQLLGVSRSIVSLAAGELRIEGLIRYARDRITLLDTEGLEISSCECHRILSRTINPLLSPKERLAPD